MREKDPQFSLAEIQYLRILLFGVEIGKRDINLFILFEAKHFCYKKFVTATHPIKRFLYFSLQKNLLKSHIFQHHLSKQIRLQRCAVLIHHQLLVKNGLGNVFHECNIWLQFIKHFIPIIDIEGTESQVAIQNKFFCITMSPYFLIFQRCG